MWPVVVGLGLTFGSAYFQSRAQDKAARSYSKSADAQSKAIMEMYYQTREDLQPYMKYGGQALQKYWNLLEYGPGKMERDPGYQFRLGEGEKAIDRASAARGNFFSGKRGKALTEYGQEFASNEYGKFMGRYYQKLNAYGNVAQMGQASAARVGAAGQIAVGQSSGVQMGAAGGRSLSYLEQGDIWGSAANQISAYAGYAGDAFSGGGGSYWPNVQTTRGGHLGSYGF